MAATAVTAPPRAVRPGGPTARPVVDPRGMRFAATLTSVVLALVLLTGSGWLLLVQALVFAIGTVAGVRRHPYGLLFRTAVRPRLGPPEVMEDAAPPRFAQLVGLVFTVVGTLGYLLGSPLTGQLATAVALLAALLNATVGLCLGCELYLTVARLSRRAPQPLQQPTHEGAQHEPR